MKFLILIGLLVLLYWYFARRKKKLAKNRKRELIEEMVFDENCKSYVRKKEAIKIELNGKTYYFCSKKCVKEFLEKIPKLQS